MKRLFICFIFYLIFVLKVQEVYALVEFRPDFAKEEKLAKEYSKERYDAFKERLLSSRNDLRTLEMINKKQDLLNGFNQFADIQGIEEVMKEPMFLDFDAKLRDLFKKADKVSNRQFVYITSSAEQIGRFSNNYWNDKQNSSYIDTAKFEEFKEDFKFADINGYVLASLHNGGIDLVAGERLLFRYEVPKGTSIIYLEDGKVVLDRSTGMEVSDMYKTTFKGRQIISSEAKLISERDVEQRLKLGEKAINDLIKNYLSLENFDGIKIEAKSYRSSITLKRAEKAIEHIFDSLPEKLLKLGFEVYRNSDGSGKLNIIFQDKPVESEDGDNTVAYYEPNENRIYYNITHSSLMGENLSKSNYLKMLMHEFSHSLDLNVFSDTDSGTVKRFSESEQFKELFKEESGNLTDETTDILDDVLYGQKNEKEYFAEVFANMFSEDQNLVNLIKQQVPKTYDYINEAVSQFK